MMRRRLGALRRRFFFQPTRLQTREGVTERSQRGPRPTWVLGRSLCLYRSHDFGNVPRDRRDAALATQVGLWSPFEATGHHVVWHGSLAQVWYWDQAALDPSHEQGHAGNAFDVVPEPAMYGPQYGQQGDAVVLLGAVEGFDAQVWRDGVLRASTWFAEPPVEAQLDALGRRFAVGGDVRSVESPTWLAEPWQTPPDLFTRLLRMEMPALVVTITLLVTLAIAQEARIFRLGWAERAVESRLEQLDQDVEPLLAARRSHDRLLELNTRMLELLNQPSQSHLMTEVSEHMPGGTQFQRWFYQPGELQFTVKGEGADPAAYVRTLSDIRYLKDVRAAAGRLRGELDFRGRLDESLAARSQGG